ncbi:hypothetical protein M758_UG297500 [Ceratodon purpureus]|nr:hypothetical protein M758_UG297500 [Ceratodon purpureus]
MSAGPVFSSGICLCVGSCPVVVCGNSSSVHCRHRGMSSVQVVILWNSASDWIHFQVHGTCQFDIYGLFRSSIGAGCCRRKAIISTLTSWYSGGSPYRRLGFYFMPILFLCKMEGLQDAVVAEMEEVRAWYFIAVLTSKAQCDQQEIPAAFTKRTGWPADSECNLVTSIETLNQWPIRFKEHGDSAGTKAWVSVGGGYSKFLAENKIALPVLLGLRDGG